MIYVSVRESRIADHCSDGRPFVREVSGLSAVAYRGLSIASSKQQRAKSKALHVVSLFILNLTKEIKHLCLLSNRVIRIARERVPKKKYILNVSIRKCTQLCKQSINQNQLIEPSSDDRMMSQFLNNIYLRIASLRILGIKKNSTKSGKTKKKRKIDVTSHSYDL